MRARTVFASVRHRALQVRQFFVSLFDRTGSGHRLIKRQKRLKYVRLMREDSEEIRHLTELLFQVVEDRFKSCVGLLLRHRGYCCHSYLHEQTAGMDAHRPVPDSCPDPPRAMLPLALAIVGTFQSQKRILSS